jgi:hypothetical protein
MSTTTVTPDRPADVLAAPDVRPFRRSRTGWVVTALNLLAAASSTHFFLGVLGTGVAGWLMMNSCAPSIAVFTAGFLLARPTLMVAGAVMMFRYGTLGLFLFGWDGPNLVAQASHGLMTLAVLYVIADVVSGRRFAALGRGAGLGLALLVPYMVAQHLYFGAHPGLLEQLFSGSFTVAG